MKNYIRINLHSGKNSQISLFFEIIGVLPPFEKYLVIYHFLKLDFYKLKFDMELKFKKIEQLTTRVYKTRVPWNKTICLCLNNEKNIIIIDKSTIVASPIPRGLEKRKKKEKPTPGRSQSIKLALITNGQIYFLTIYVQNKRLFKINYVISQSVCCLIMI